MSYLANLIDGMSSLIVTWISIAEVHRRTCDCQDAQPPVTDVFLVRSS
ncbi:hypothetical protein ACVDFE_02010 [Lentzea chajnantorensis]